MTVRVLLAGESWNTYAVHTKGASAYTTAGYEEGADQLIEVLGRAGHDVTYLPNHRVVEEFPYTAAELATAYDVVVLSDLPADSLLLPRAVFVQGERRPNRLRELTEYIHGGGGLLMVGGYMSFAGFEGRARYAATALAAALPVTIAHHDDRVEAPEGVVPVVERDHAVLDGVTDWPYFLGYNRVRAGDGVLLSADGDPLLVVGAHGAGRTAAFASDCSPHWGSPAFMAWPHYARFWSQLVTWLAGKDATAN
ncbi:glutamine amidotransferase [Jiangella asiatica]|uniref:Cytoplasmic protein n=1 Tax=Jiangella asiatica TaxID=2530372 RepID=A0A4R5CLF4_9ACTN|nr:glutamine amidotransferase [Jiangella asiatica]TDE01162.1 cytoplasmic protein [Jiangella asiatica]